jgi:RNA polymerase sigma-70 factor (ECF subfamily)
MDTLLSGQVPGTASDDASDAELAARALHNPEAFTALYRVYALDVYRYCYRRLRNREAAEDATSQTFLDAYRGLRRLGDKPFRPWLFAIAHNVVVDVHRNRRPLFPLDGLTAREHSDPSPETIALDWEYQDAVQQLLRQLPKRDREVVELRLSGLTGGEIAQTLNCSPEAVRAAHYRAMQRMRALVTAEGILDL